jgi:hypothetical protein
MVWRTLPPAGRYNLAAVRTLDCPLLVFAGRHDFNVNSQLAADWFAKVEAPSKHFVWFEHSAHLPMTRSRQIPAGADDLCAASGVSFTNCGASPSMNRVSDANK